MTPIEKQILKNQRAIIEHLFHNDAETKSYLGDREEEITKILCDGEQEEEPCCEMPPRDRIDGYMETLDKNGINGLRTQLHGEFLKSKQEKTRE